MTKDTITAMDTVIFLFGISAIFGTCVGQSDEPINITTAQPPTVPPSTTAPPPTVPAREYTELTTKNGVLRGEVKHLQDGPVSVFLGVPFAKPPVGDLRFKAPQNVESWPNIRDATVPPNICTQDVTKPIQRMNDLFGQQVYTGNGLVTSEDCLYLNVYVPGNINSHFVSYPITNSSTNSTVEYVTKETKDQLNVMLWLHWGDFDSGWGHMMDGSMLALKGNVIVVTTNYRLGVFGFTSTNDDVMPGNYGMLDQVMAMQWIKDNIADFGGSGSDVTIFGDSSGSICVGLHMLSPMSRGLFKAAISQSGFSTSLLDIQKSHYLTAKELVKQVFCEGPPTKSQGIYECLMNETANTLFSAANTLMMEDTHIITEVSTYIFVPSIDGTFLPADPKVLWETGQFTNVPHIIGINENDGSIALGENLDLYTNWNDFQAFTRRLLSKYVGSKNLRGIGALLANEYVPRPPTAANYINAAMRMIRDIVFLGPAMAIASSRAAKTNAADTYMYQLEHRLSSIEGLPNYIGAPHYGLLPILFTISNTSLTEEERNLRIQVITAWTNFAKTGDPNPSGQDAGIKWNAFTSTNTYYLSIATNMTETSTLGKDLGGKEAVILNEVIGNIQSASMPACISSPPSRDTSYPVANTSQGAILGLELTDDSGRIWEEYRGIPYAAPPVGRFRWTKPLAPVTWQGLRDATKFGPHCIQIPDSGLTSSQETNEDCLYLNVIVPQGVKYIRYMQVPVMVFIHGEEANVGEGAFYNFGQLAELGEVIIVTLNYRLGMFGFFSTGDDSSVGNYALWDQRYAIMWVRNNIANFGGDPSKITLWGHYIGAQYVALHIASPQNKGLFQRSILQSPLRMNVETNTRVMQESVSYTVGNLSCNSDTTQLMVDCLRTKSADDILSYSDFKSGGSKIPWVPVIDSDIVFGDPFLSAANRTNVDILAGAVNSGAYKQYKEANIDITKNRDLKQYVDILLAPNYHNPDAISQLIRVKYLSTMFDYQDMTVKEEAFVKVMNEYMITSYTERNAAFNFENGGRSFLYKHTKTYDETVPSWVQGMHGDDLRTLTDGPENLPAKYLRTSFRTYITNFVQNGDPNVGFTTSKTWPAYEPTEDVDLWDKVYELVVGDNITIENVSDQDELVKVWNDVVPSLDDATPYVCPPIEHPSIPEQFDAYEENSFAPKRCDESDPEDFMNIGTIQLTKTEAEITIAVLFSLSALFLVMVIICLGTTVARR